MVGECLFNPKLSPVILQAVNQVYNTTKAYGCQTPRIYHYSYNDVDFFLTLVNRPRAASNKETQNTEYYL